MIARVSVRTGMLIAGGIVAVALVGFMALPGSNPPPGPAKKTAEKRLQPTVESLPPSLDCAFNAFMHSSTAINFYFDVTMPEGAPPLFLERAFVAADGERQVHEDDDRPVWTYGLDGDNQPTITSPDGATTIVLYGLKLGLSGIGKVEAGVRSNVFRNLGGQCRQTNLDGKKR